jgi:hypothetical protein
MDQAESRAGGARAASGRPCGEEGADVSKEKDAWNSSPAGAKRTVLGLSAVSSSLPTPQNRHFVATCEEMGAGVFESAGAPVDVATAISDPCPVPPSACPKSPPAVQSKTSESANALETQVLFVSVVTRQFPNSIDRLAKESD